jgi:ABC-type multidrug transport system fused ATPase/permease subunit
VGGVDINLISDEERVKLFGFVFQNINFYHVLLRENIAVGDKLKLDNNEELIKALKNAVAEELLQKTDSNLDTQVGWYSEQGITFSGGEKQRLQITRCFLSPHIFVVLDEPVASLDALAESKMYESFLKFFKNKGVIAISHRLASAKMADEIIMLENGTVEAIGSHSQLMKTNKLYKKMFTLQASHYTDKATEANENSEDESEE